MADVAPHLAFPLRLRAGRFLRVEQGSDRALQDQAEVVVRTHPQTFDHEPEFGMAQLVGTLGPVSPEIVTAVASFVGADAASRVAAVEDESMLGQRIRAVALDVAAEQED